MIKDLIRMSVAMDKCSDATGIFLYCMILMWIWIIFRKYYKTIKISFNFTD